MSDNESYSKRSRISSPIDEENSSIAYILSFVERMKPFEMSENPSKNKSLMYESLLEACRPELESVAKQKLEKKFERLKVKCVALCLVFILTFSLYFQKNFIEKHSGTKKVFRRDPDNYVATNLANEVKRCGEKLCQELRRNGGEQKLMEMIENHLKLQVDFST